MMRAIDLFAGAGGNSEGARMAGMDGRAMLQMPKPDVIRRPVERDGAVTQAEARIETIELGARNKATDRAPYIRIQISRADDGLWMWSASFQNTWGGWGYRVGPKWGKFATSRHDAIVAACREIVDRSGDRVVPRSAMEWMADLCGPAQLEMFR